MLTNMTEILSIHDKHASNQQTRAHNQDGIVASGTKRTTLALPHSWDTCYMQQMDGSRTNKRSKRGDTTRHNNISMVQNEIKSFAAVAPDSIELCMDKQLRDIISRQSFQQILEVMEKNDHQHTQSIPEVTRAYEEQYMRACRKSENPCVMGDKCECMFIDTDKSFVGTQFVFPTLHIENSMCILCLRKTTQLLFYKIIQKGLPATIPIQKHGNICNKPGEYHPEAMLVCPPSGPLHCLPLPIVAHQRNRYTVHEIHGIKYIKQHGVGMEDFHMPLSQIKI
jgi:hypothetical protein